MSEEAEIEVLKVKLQSLKDKVSYDEIKYTRWIQELESRSDSIEARIRLGKGVLIGIFFTLGSLSIIAFDKLSNTVLKALKLLS